MLETGELLYEVLTFTPHMQEIIILLIVFVFFSFTITVVKGMLLKRAKGKKHISNIKIFSRLLRYLLFIIVIVVGLFSITNSWTGLGLSVGLASAALGWALQRPITGIAAWIMVITRRPFDIGDRIVLGEHSGDVTDITISHIYIDEIAGIIPTDENSGRTVMIPNHLLFETPIINYTVKDNFILDEVVTSITYESNLDTAIKIILSAGKKITKDFKNKKEPYIRVFFADSAVNVHVRYFVSADKRQLTASKITKEIYDQHLKVKDMEIAYPHMEVMHRKI